MTLTLERLSYALDKRFKDLIDMSDTAKDSAEDKRLKFLTRAQAAYCLTVLTSADPSERGTVHY
jgi:hypothetical protein